MWMMKENGKLQLNLEDQLFPTLHAKVSCRKRGGGCCQLTRHPCQDCYITSQPPAGGWQVNLLFKVSFPAG